MPSQDIILGLYYALEREAQPGEGMVFRDIAEVEHALNSGAVTLHTKVQARVEVVDENGETVMKRMQVTSGRLKILQILPRSSMAPIDVINRVLTKKEVSNVIDVVYRHCGQKGR